MLSGFELYPRWVPLNFVLFDEHLRVMGFQRSLQLAIKKESHNIRTLASFF